VQTLEAKVQVADLVRGARQGVTTVAGVMFQYCFRALCKSVIEVDTYELEVDLGFYINHCAIVQLRSPSRKDRFDIVGEDDVRLSQVAKGRVIQLIGNKWVVIRTEKPKRPYDRWCVDLYFLGVDNREYNLCEVLKQEGLLR